MVSDLGVIVVNTSEFEFREATVVRAVATGEWIGDVTDGTAGESAITVGEEDVIIREGEGRRENKGGEKCGEEEESCCGGAAAIDGGGGGRRVGERHLECKERMNELGVYLGIIAEREFGRC